MFLLNFLAHFVPPERAGFQPDDDFIAAYGLRLPLSHGTKDLVSLDRPLTRAFQLATGRALGRSAGIRVQVWGVVAGSYLLVVAAFFFLAELLQHRGFGFAAASIYCLLPNRLELHGTLMYAGLGSFLALYVLSGWALLRYLKANRQSWLMASLGLYTLALGGYELGFLMPLAVVVLASPGGPSPRRTLAWFALPAVAFGGLRVAAMIGLLPDMNSRPIEWTSIGWNALWAVPNHYVGRYVARAVAYGLLGFREMSPPWIWLALMANALLVGAVMAAWGRVAGRPAPSPVAAGRAVVAAFLLLGPALLVSVQGRHTALASVVLCGWVIGPVARLGRGVVAALLALLLTVSQGDAWHSVVAGRINRAIFETMVRRAGEIRAAERIVVDVHSFATAIPYTLGERERNVLHYYWGVAVLGSWGLDGMVALAAGQPKPILACATEPARAGGELSCREHFTPPGPAEVRRVPLAGTLVLSFDDVYPAGFDPVRGDP